MSLMTGFTARQAYSKHVAANRLSDKGQHAEAKAKYAEARALYEKAVAEGCETPRILMAYGVLLLKQRDFDKAHDIMLKTEKLKGLTADEKKQLRLNFAVCQWKRGLLDQAIEQMKMAAGDTKTSMVYGSLGFMLIEKARRTGDFAEAEAFNQEAYEYDEDDPVVLDNLGQLYYSMGEKDKALEYFKRANEKKPTQVDTLYFLAKIAREEGRDEEARGFIEKALKGNYSALCTTDRGEAVKLAKELGVSE